MFAISSKQGIPEFTMSPPLILLNVLGGSESKHGKGCMLYSSSILSCLYMSSLLV